VSDELNPDVRRLVDLARRARTPDAGDKRRVAERLAVPLATGAAVGTATAAAKAVGLGALGAKLGAVVAVAVAVSAVVVTQRAREPRATPSQAASGSAAAPPLPSATVLAPQPSVVPPLPASAAAPRARSSPPAPSRSLTSASELEEEAALLHRAQSAWRAGESARALQLANEHAQRFPRSQLTNERDVLRVLSLCKLGRVESAKQVGARLLLSARGSPWYPSIAGSCAAEKSP
jgi:hypothetical protein